MSNLSNELDRILSEELKDRLMATHLANASDTARRLDRDDHETGIGVFKGIAYVVLIWVIVGAVYLMLTAGG